MINFLVALASPSLDLRELPSPPVLHNIAMRSRFDEYLIALKKTSDILESFAALNEAERKKALKVWWNSVKGEHSKAVISAQLPFQSISNSIDISKIDLVLLRIGKYPVFEFDKDSLITLYNLKSEDGRKYQVNLKIKNWTQELLDQTRHGSLGAMIHAYSFEHEMRKPRAVIESWLNSKNMAFGALK